MRVLAALAVLVSFGLMADTTVERGDWALYRGTSIVSRHATEAACIQAADDRNELRTFTCRTITRVIVTADTAPEPTPEPTPEPAPEPEEGCFAGCVTENGVRWCRTRQPAACLDGYTESASGNASWPWTYSTGETPPEEPGEEPPEEPGEEPGEEPPPPTEPPPPGELPEGWPAEIAQVPFDWERVPQVNQTVALNVGSDGTSLAVADGLTGTITGTGDPVVGIACNGGVIHNLRATGVTIRVSGSNCVWRDSVIDGDGRTTKNGTSMSGTNMVFTRNVVTRMLGNDRHCVTTGEGSSGFWIFDNDLSECSGDAFQAGHQQQADPPRNIYIFHNRMHHNRENAVDLKWVDGVWVVENQMYGHRPAPSDSSWCLPSMPTRCSVSNSGSDGTGMVFGADGTAMNVRALRNENFDNASAFRVESGGGVTDIIGNRIHSLRAFEGSSVAIQLDKDGPNTRIIGNDISAGIGIRQNWRTNFCLTVDRNTFRGAQIRIESGTVAVCSTLTNNVFTPPVSIVWANQVTSNPATIGSGNVAQ